MQDSDNAAPATPTPRPPRRLAPVAILIAVTNVVLFILLELNGGSKNPATLLRFGALERNHVLMGEYWRLGAAMFLHIGWVHVLINTYVLFGWCKELERALGSMKLVAVYLLTGLGASAASVLFQGNLSAGASGAGFGVVGTTLFLVYRALGSWKAFYGSRQVRFMLWFLVVFLAIGFLPQVPFDNFAHLGGLLFGVLLGWALVPAPGRRRSAAAGVVVIALLAGTIVASTHPWPWMKSPRGVDMALALFRKARAEKDFARAEKFLKTARLLGLSEEQVHDIEKHLPGADLFEAKRALEQAVEALDAGRPEEALKLVERAEALGLKPAEVFRVKSSIPETRESEAKRLWREAARALDDKDPEKATELLRQAEEAGLPATWAGRLRQGILQSARP